MFEVAPDVPQGLLDLSVDAGGPRVRSRPRRLSRAAGGARPRRGCRSARRHRSGTRRHARGGLSGRASRDAARRSETGTDPASMASGLAPAAPRRHRARAALPAALPMTRIPECCVSTGDPQGVGPEVSVAAARVIAASGEARVRARRASRCAREGRSRPGVAPPRSGCRGGRPRFGGRGALPRGTRRTAALGGRGPRRSMRSISR
jgi:hypothetical protein